ncbi:MAG TPA: hypothetical protein VJV79_05790 [Polyangiaceae bacterium]|nr:hypothetical protein [Polyangiaceae bacterium]
MAKRGTCTAAPPTVPAELKALSPRPLLPADPTNKYADDSDAAVLGQQLFFDKPALDASSLDAAHFPAAGKPGDARC